MTTVAVAGGIAGVALFGTGPLTTLSGSQLDFPAALGRLALVVLYLSAGIAALGAVGLFISTLTEQPIAATIALTIFTILSWILDGVPQLAWLHPWLLVDRWLAFADLLRDPPFWDTVLPGPRPGPRVCRGVLAAGLGPVRGQGHHELSAGRPGRQLDVETLLVLSGR